MATQGPARMSTGDWLLLGVLIIACAVLLGIRQSLASIDAHIRWIAQILEKWVSSGQEAQFKHDFERIEEAIKEHAPILERISENVEELMPPVSKRASTLERLREEGHRSAQSWWSDAERLSTEESLHDFCSRYALKAHQGGELASGGSPLSEEVLKLGVIEMAAFLRSTQVLLPRRRKDEVLHLGGEVFQSIDEVAQAYVASARAQLELIGMFRPEESA